MSKYEELTSFCDNVRILRKSNNFSKKRMSKIMGISVYSLSLIEKGVIPKRLSMNAVFSVALFFEVSVANMFVAIEGI